MKISYNYSKLELLKLTLNELWLDSAFCFALRVFFLLVFFLITKKILLVAPFLFYTWKCELRVALRVNRYKNLLIAGG